MVNQLPLRLAVTGVTGRMGKTIVRRIIEKQNQQINKEIVLGAAISSVKSNVCGVDVGTFIQSSKIGVMITNNIELVKEDFDVVVDFTSPQATIEYLKFCVLHHKNIIIGTTGFNKDHLYLIQNASQKIGIVCSANFSVGIATMLKLLQEVSKIIEKNMDIDIIEVHHNKKKDIPSGTALMMRSVIEQCRLLDHCSLNINYPYDVNNRYDNFHKSSLSGSINSIPIHSIRSGDTVGDHTVLFSMSGENLKITHKAYSRMIFADGALCSAEWLGCSKIGLFNLSDVLGFNM